MLDGEQPMANQPRIAVLVPNFLGVTRAVLGGIGRYTREHAPWVIVNNPWQQAERGLELPQGPIEGVILCFPDILKGRHGRKIPTVLVTERFVDVALPRVIPDSAAIGRLAAAHLIDCGFRHLAYVGYPEATFSRRRGEGFVQAVRSAGLPCHVFGPVEGSRSADDRRIRARQIRRWLNRLPRPVGLMACNDHMGMVMLGICREAGLRVPADVAVVGVDNDELVCDFCNPSLTSVRLNSREAGYQAARLLHILLRGQKAPRGPIVMQPLGVIRRQSSDIVLIGGEEVGGAIKYMRDHACEGIFVKDVLRATSMGRRTLEKACRQLLGRSPFQEIRRIQMERAMDLLRTSDSSIATIAGLVGFGEGKRLSEAFRSHVGLTPSEYRRAKRDPSARIDAAASDRSVLQ
jgi:LacI family transcriptional regulator